MTRPAEIADRHAIAPFAIAIVLLVALYRTTAMSIVAEWASNPLGQGYVVIVLSGFLVWANWRSIVSASLRPSAYGLVLLAAASFLWLMAHLSGTLIVAQLSLLVLLTGICWAVLGAGAVRALAFPLTLLIFALPIGARAIPMLQLLTAQFAVRALQAAGTPALLEGEVISIPGSSWLVAEACSGINYLMSSLTVGYAYAGLAYRSWRYRIAFVVAAALIPLAANGIRVFTTIFIASRGATRIAAGLGHDAYGWIVFAVTMAVLFTCFGRWPERPTSQREDGNASGLPPKPALPSRFRAAAALSLAVASVAPIYARYLDVQPSEPPGRPTVMAPWTTTSDPSADWSPKFEVGDAHYTETFESRGRVVTLHVVQFAEAGDVVTASVAAADSQWLITDRADRAVALSSGALRVRETSLQALNGSLLLWGWYIVDGTPTASDYLAKLLAVRARLSRRTTGATAVQLGTRVEAGTDPAAVLHDFVEHLRWPD